MQIADLFLHDFFESTSNIPTSASVNNNYTSQLPDNIGQGNDIQLCDSRPDVLPVISYCDRFQAKKLNGPRTTRTSWSNEVKTLTDTAVLNR